MKRFFENVNVRSSTIMAIITLMCIMIVPAGAAFQDIPQSSWATNYIDYAEAYGLINGIGDGRFAPNATLTEAQCCQIIYNGLVTKNTQATGVRWYTEAVDWVQSRWRSVTIVPDKAATRLFVAELLTEFGPPIEPRTSYNYNPFTDCNMLSNYESYAINSCRKRGIISGYQDGTFRPYNKLTRAEGAKMFSIWHHQEFYDTPDPAKAMSLQQKAEAEAKTMGRYAQSLGWKAEAAPWPYNHNDGTYWYQLEANNQNGTFEFLVGGSISGTDTWWHIVTQDGFKNLSKESVKASLAKWAT